MKSKYDRHTQFYYVIFDLIVNQIRNNINCESEKELSNIRKLNYNF